MPTTMTTSKPKLQRGQEAVGVSGLLSLSLLLLPFRSQPAPGLNMATDSKAKEWEEQRAERERHVCRQASVLRLVLLPNLWVVAFVKLFHILYSIQG